MGTNRVGKLGELADEQIPRSVAHQHRPLHLGLDRHEAHRGLGHSSADRLCIRSIGLAPLDEGLDVRGRDQPHLMAELCQLTRSIMRPGTGFHPNQAWGKA